MNLYLYANQSPATYIDPTGLFSRKLIPPALLLLYEIYQITDYAVESYQWSQINKLFWQQRRWIRRQLDEVDPYCEPEKWKLLYDAYYELVRMHAREAARWGISTVNIAIPYGSRPRK